ncbi:MAG: nuclear transport factor 2 family protein [Planctomycetes bacterium]|nr:nuclear transport factor 2 family protein [Planctomycetota bacterium]
MGKPTPPLAAETAAVAEAYAALNRNDISGFVKDFDPQIVRTEPVELAGGGSYHGIEAVKAHVAHHRGNWAEGSCEPQRFMVAGDKVIAFVHVRVRLKHESEWREGHTVDVYTFHNGKAVEFRTFVDEREALAWAGADAPDTH